MKRQEVASFYKDLSSYAGKTVTVCGWARSIRDSKTLGFIDLNDGTSFKGVQIVFEDGKIDNFKEIASQNVGAALRVTGTLLATPEAKQPFEIRTMVYPGFPTDLQAPMMAVACKTPGTSVFLETIFENRFMHAAELSRLGAHIRVENRVAVVEGTPYLTGAPVRATDLRAGAALILAGLCAEGETLVDDSGGHIERGYCGIEEKLRAVGGRIERVAL